MSIDFELTRRQRALKYDVREFAREVLRPAAERADAMSDAQAAFVAMKPAFEQAYMMGLATSFLPREYGGGGASNVDMVIATEELCAVDAGFATIILVNGLALLPVVWFGTERQRERWITAATGCPTMDHLGGWVVSERGGTANFDHPHPSAGIQLFAHHDKANSEYVLNGEKHWPCNAGGWDLRGADTNVCIVRTDRTRGGTHALSAVVVDRGTPGLEYEVIDKIGLRTCQNVTMRFDDVRVPEENLFAEGNGDLVVNRAFTWSAPMASAAAVGVARGAYEFALKWAKTYTGGGSSPIIAHQAVGHLLTEIAARIEAGRYMCWKAAHYLDRHDGQGHALAAMNKVYCADLMKDVVVDCMRIVGVNALDRKFGMEKFYREAIVFPLYDAGNLGMQRRKSWGVMADPAFTPDLFADDDPFAFTKSMEGYGVLGGSPADAAPPRFRTT
ncbi:acyl-CoA dehydrogenase family protein [Pseudonocardia dioxanivorans]|uniref:acyl-CoA dehydrogenase family protein n=1 Tax=Pseudonocardia dioxanivorans TaxID=240495 RepID=UPI000CD13CE1|nr:acyl-CoA dehydrogenase family protein [Pseudonocardia dioxanivorans]